MNHSCRGSQQGVMDPSLTSGLQPRGFAPERQGPRMSGFEASGAGMGERWRAIVSRDFALKGHTQNLTHSKSPNAEAVIRKESVRPTCLLIFESFLERQLRLSLVTETVVAGILGISFYHEATSAGKHHLCVLLTY